MLSAWMRTVWVTPRHSHAVISTTTALRPSRALWDLTTASRSNLRSPCDRSQAVARHAENCPAQRHSLIAWELATQSEGCALR